LVASIAAASIIQPGQIEAQTGDLAAVFPDSGTGAGVTTLLKSGVAHSLVYDCRKLEPVPPEAELKAFQMEKECGIERVSLYRKIPAKVCNFIVFCRLLSSRV